MGETPLVSVCVQTYQHAPYIAECLDGIVMQQTTFPFEVIVGEDDSTDGTRAICQDYAQRYPDKIRLFLRSEKDKIYINGVKTGRFNFTENLKAARGKYIALTDGDDYWTDPQKLQKQADFLEAHPEYVLCFTNAYNLLRDGTPVDYIKKHFGVCIRETVTPEDLVYTNFIPTASVMFHHVLHEFPPKFMQAPAGDWVLYFLLGQYGKFRFLDEITSVRRVHSGGIISCQPRDVVLNIRIGCYQAIDSITQKKFHARLQQYINKHRFELYAYYRDQKRWKAASQQLVSNVIHAPLHSLRLIWRPEDLRPASNFLRVRLTPDKVDLYIIRQAIFRALKSQKSYMQGVLLDIGCGQMPYKEFILTHSNVERYIGMDLEGGRNYNNVRPDLLWDGKTIPLDDVSIDCAIATEVFEHAPDLTGLLREIARVLKPNGVLFFTTPFFWPLHEAPYDEYRYTPFALQRHLQNAGFTNIQLKAMGGWDASFAQMIGLWARRRPMSAMKRRLVSAVAVPIMRWLLMHDVVPQEFHDGPMITGIWGVVSKGGA